MGRGIFTDFDFNYDWHLFGNFVFWLEPKSIVSLINDFHWNPINWWNIRRFILKWLLQTWNQAFSNVADNVYYNAVALLRFSCLIMICMHLAYGVILKWTSFLLKWNNDNRFSAHSHVVSWNISFSFFTFCFFSVAWLLAGDGGQLERKYWKYYFEFETSGSTIATERVLSNLTVSGY